MSYYICIPEVGRTVKISEGITGNYIAITSVSELKIKVYYSFLVPIKTACYVRNIIHLDFINATLDKIFPYL